MRIPNRGGVVWETLKALLGDERGMYARGTAIGERVSRRFHEEVVLGKEANIKHTRQLQL